MATKRIVESHPVHSLDDLKTLLDRFERNWTGLGTRGSEIGLEARVDLVQTRLTDKSVVYDIVINQDC